VRVKFIVKNHNQKSQSKINIQVKPKYSGRYYSKYPAEYCAKSIGYRLLMMV